MTVDVRFENLKVLVVDPDPLTGSLDIVRSALMMLGIGVVREVSDVPRAFARMSDFAPDLIVVAMGAAMGAAFAERVRRDASSPRPALPIITVSEAMDAPSLRQLRDSGVNEMLIFPITASALRLRIEAALGHPRPFVRVMDYVGPCRRRSTAPYNGPERRKSQQGIA